MDYPFAGFFSVQRFELLPLLVWADESQNKIRKNGVPPVEIFGWNASTVVLQHVGFDCGFKACF